MVVYLIRECNELLLGGLMHGDGLHSITCNCLASIFLLYSLAFDDDAQVAEARRSDLRILGSGRNNPGIGNGQDVLYLRAELSLFRSMGMIDHGWK